MNLILVLQGIIEILMSAVCGILIFILSFKIFSLLTRDIEEIAEIKKNNIAVAILGASFVFGIMLLIKSAISPSMDTLKGVLTSNQISTQLVLFSILRIALIYTFSAIFSFTILWVSVKLFTILTTDIDELREIKNNNISVSLILATLILSMSLILTEPLKTLLDGMVYIPIRSTAGVSNTLINMPVFLQGLIELGISLIGTIFVFFLSFKMFSLLTKKINEVEELKNNNLAISILMCSFIFGIMILIRAAVAPANDALGFALSGDNISFSVLLFTLLRVVLFFIISSVVAFIVIWASMNMFMLITKNIDELSEVKNRNVAVAIILAFLIISASLLIEHGLVVLLEGLIKAPQLGRGLIDLSNIK